MGKLYEARLKIEKIIEQKGLDIFKIKGSIGLKSGLLINFINSDTPDDDIKLQKLRDAVKDVLGENI